MKSGITKKSVVCNNCGVADEDFVTEGYEHEYTDTTDDSFRVVKCRRCGLLYLNPRPDVSELKTIYPDSYYAYGLQEKNVESENRSSLLYKARRHVYLSRLEKALMLCGKEGKLKVLDIGCADGRALNWYKQIQSFEVKTYGVDFDEKAVDKARQSGHEVYLGRFEEADIPDNTFDMAVATHVIEHVADPKQFARRAWDVLKPGGIFLCETPNADSLDASWFRNKHWGGYHFPRHWVFYSPRSIKKLAADVGFEFVRIDFHPAPAFWNWTFHSITAGWAKDLARSGRGLIRSLSAPVRNLGDWLFPPVDFQKNNLRNLFFVSLYTGFDVIIKAIAGKTSNMAVVLRKPAS